MKTLLLTGATGFVGKVVLAELMRRRAELGVARVYVLIRDKRGVAPARRFADDVATSPVFRTLGADWQHAVVPVACELTAAGCGLSPEDAARLQAEVTHVIHCAASVEFDLPLAEAAAANITSALQMLALARGCKHLQRMVSVSTAYVTPWKPDLGEAPAALVPMPFDPAATYAAILAGQADAEALMAASGHPNTYTLTKCIAEHLLTATAAEAGTPLTLVRPSIVSATLRHPVPGWIDSAAAFAGFVALIGAGRMRMVVADRASRLDVVPCDVVADVAIAAAFADPGHSAGASIRHAVAGKDRNLGIGACVDGIEGFFRAHPAARPKAVVRWVGPPGAAAAFHHARHHALPLHAAGTVLEVAGASRQARQSKRLAAKLGYVNRAFAYFTHKAFDFQVTEPEAWPGFEPSAYVALACAGVSRHLLRAEPDHVAMAGPRLRGTWSDTAWALTQPQGNAAIRGFGWVLRKVFRRATEQVTIDLPSFQRAMAAVPQGTALALAPSHRSYMDFLLCSFLTFERPELGIKVPHIAAAEEFSRIPVLGWLFTKTQAFYLKRGVGREDPELTRTVHGIMARGEVVKFFVEGARSRSRQFLRPKTGLVRCMQATGRPVALLPIAVTYDRVPEEAVLARELAGEPKEKMRLGPLLGWTGKMLRGKVALGRIHIACAPPVVVAPEDDAREAVARVMAGLQSHTAITTYHLRCFVARAGVEGLTVAWLRDQLARRGAPVIDSELKDEHAVGPVTELSLRQQWLPWFLPDALARWPESPALRHEAAARSWIAPAPVAGADGDARLTAMLAVAFGPLLIDADRVVQRLGDPRWAPRIETPGMILPECTGMHLLHAQAVFEDLVARGILAVEPGATRHAWGPEAGAIADHRARTRAAAEAVAPWFTADPAVAAGSPL